MVCENFKGVTEELKKNITLIKLEMVSLRLGSNLINFSSQITFLKVWENVQLIAGAKKVFNHFMLIIICLSF